MKFNFDETVCALTDGLPGRTKSPAMDIDQCKTLQGLTKDKALEATIATWNDFSKKFVPFADEHSTL